MSKWKKRYERLKDSAMCRNVWADLNIDPDGTVRVRYRHKCGDDCPFTEELRRD